MMLELGGLHHLTAITARAADNRKFYTEVMGMRLVKKTVNQDDTSAYHLFYGDGAATAGSDITFFDWPAPREQRGTHSVVRTGLRVSGKGTLAYWRDRLTEAGVLVEGLALRNGRETLAFEDPEGQRLLLVDDGGEGEAHPWNKASVPPERQIRGLGPMTLSVPRLSRTSKVLLEVMNMRAGGTYADPVNPGSKVSVFAMGPGGAAAELHVIEEPDAPMASQGAGAVHHVAFRTPGPAELTAWAERLNTMGLRNSGEVERYYFRSLYFREPGGVLFEIATDGPGFTADEPLATLGEKLSLPPFLEPKRASIEARLKPV
jgi:glyoxalase family protein